MRSIALITSGAQTVANFRGPLIRRLVADGVRVWSLAPDYDAESRAAVAALGAEPVDVSLDRTGMHPLRDMADAVRLRSLLRRLRPEAVLCSFVKPVIYGTLAAAAAGVPRRVAMLEGLGYAYNEADGRAGLKRRLVRGVLDTLFRAAFRAADRVVFLNDEDLALMVRGGVLPAAKAVNIGAIGVDLDQFAPLPPHDGPVTFTLLARLLREKGVEEFVAAARILKRVAPDVRFVLLGALDANPTGLSEVEVRAWVAEGAVQWPGHVADVRPWIAASSAIVLPSYYREGVPRSLQEAAAMARAIVTTDNVGCRDTVEEGINGFLVPVRNPEALAAALMRFVEEPGLAARMGRASRELAERRFDARVANGRLLALLT